MEFYTIQTEQPTKASSDVIFNNTVQANIIEHQMERLESKLIKEIVEYVAQHNSLFDEPVEFLNRVRYALVNLLAFPFILTWVGGGNPLYFTVQYNSVSGIYPNHYETSITVDCVIAGGNQIIN